MIDTNNNDNSAIADTSYIQWESVVRFMKPFGLFFNGRSFVSPHDKHFAFSVNTAIKMHNDLRMKSSNRLVAKAKLQWSKKNKSLICQSNIVKMMNGNKLEDWVDVSQVL